MVRLKEGLRLLFFSCDDETNIRLKIGTKVYAYSVSKGRLSRVPNCPRMA